jgi:hypothetical protein
VDVHAALVGRWISSGLGRRVSATGVDGTLAALNARTGGLLWKHKLPYHSLVEAPVGEGRPVLYVAGGLERPYVPPGAEPTTGCAPAAAAVPYGQKSSYKAGKPYGR